MYETLNNLTPVNLQRHTCCTLDLTNSPSLSPVILWWGLIAYKLVPELPSEKMRLLILDHILILLRPVPVPEEEGRPIYVLPRCSGSGYLLLLLLSQQQDSAAHSIPSMLTSRDCTWPFDVPCMSIVLTLSTIYQHNLISPHCPHFV